MHSSISCSSKLPLHWPVREDTSAWPVREDMSALFTMVQHLPSWIVAPAPLRGLAALVLTEVSVFPLEVTGCNISMPNVFRHLYFISACPSRTALAVPFGGTTAHVPHSPPGTAHELLMLSLPNASVSFG